MPAGICDGSRLIVAVAIPAPETGSVPGITLTVPTAVPFSENVTCPVGGTAWLLEVIFAVSVTGLPITTTLALGDAEIVVGAFTTL